MGIRNYNTEEERKTAHREACKRYRERHKEELAAKQAEYYKNNREEILVKQVEYNAAHKEKIAAYYAVYDATPFGRATHLIRAYRKADKKYNRGECTVTPQWMVDNVFSGQVCHYCGESNWTKLGVDRKDSSLPHTPENCVPCCKACNEKKHTTPYNDFMRRIGKIA